MYMNDTIHVYTYAHIYWDFKLTKAHILFYILAHILLLCLRKCLVRDKLNMCKNSLLFSKFSIIHAYECHHNT